MSRVLVVDDDAAMRAGLEARFLRRGWTVDTAAGAREALGKFRTNLHPLIISDVRMPGMDGFSLLHEARALAPHTAVILLTGYASVPGAVTAMKDGACDYLSKPVEFERLEQAAEKILVQAREQSESEAGLCGQSPVWLQALTRARQAAACDADVLIEAESGTGKELVARLVHRSSKRRGKAFVAINCTAFPESLLESELFGHTRGAFTGAAADKPGKFELAHGGTLLLDEVGDMPLPLQPKLLRVLQEREFDRLGGTRSVRVDLRVIATTNCSLPEMVRAGKFRADLFYRLNVIRLALPPLRERAGDVRLLAEHFARQYSTPGRPLRFAPGFLDLLEAHTWPGNVRELENCLRRAVALTAGNEINAACLDGACWDLTAASGANRAGSAGDRLRAGLSLGEVEKRLFAMTLEATGGNRSRAAQILGVSLRTVRNKVRCYGLPSWSSYAHE